MFNLLPCIYGSLKLSGRSLPGKESSIFISPEQMTHTERTSKLSPGAANLWSPNNKHPLLQLLMAPKKNETHARVRGKESAYPNHQRCD